MFVGHDVDYELDTVFLAYNENAFLGNICKQLCINLFNLSDALSSAQNYSYLNCNSRVKSFSIFLTTNEKSPLLHRCKLP